MLWGDSGITGFGPVLADQIIRLRPPWGQAWYPDRLRRFYYQDSETGKEYVFLTNRLDLTAPQVAELYRRRWHVELFYTWIKQHLKIKAFYGASENAVLIQVWTALIAYLLLLWLKFKSKVNWGLHSCPVNRVKKSPKTPGIWYNELAITH